MAVGQPVEPHILAATFVGVDHFRLNVRDVRQSVAWYCEVLGFDEPWYLGEIAILRHANSSLELVLRPRGASTGAADQSAFDHLAFRVQDRVELEAWEARLQAMGFDLKITPAVGGVSLNIEDPDGHDLELFVRTSGA
jgi:catechol 2,3-dioxygenase-like lactoylglutathione lyase family enzyme